ncbi:inactive serine/threonine-protein kinase PLK5 isoform X2 [Callorhinus ursinus]|uniref:inactive serine/threonine-protein kinase PLK5 isoform X2 n=1 Tax=Callorhinus ursinus TaxID=34884 RepID=UPI003CD03715
MEPGPRRRRTWCPPVSAFLRDPSSGRVYRRGKLIGKGAFSRCYKLVDMSTSAVFALKVVPRAEGGAGRLRSRGKVEREIALHSRLKHRNIVALHGHFADREHVYMVLEYCSRQSLAHVLEARRTLTEPEVRYYLRGLVSGLRYLHQRRIVHRDLKPSNFFLNKNMVIKIGDLGLAARVGPGGHCHRVLCGTPNFLAPEVISRNGHSCQSDIWALGCIMYTVLTGTPPFMVAPLSEMYQNIRDGRYPEPAHLSPNARRLIARLLAPNPAERPSLDLLLQDDFFTQGFTPDRLPAHSCYGPPIFTMPQPLGRLFRKVGRLLLTQCRPPCPFTPSEASGPGEEASDPDSMERGREASLLDRGAPHPEVPVHLLTQGTLRSDRTGPPGGQRQEVEVAIRNLQLCLDPGLPGRNPARPTGATCPLTSQEKCPALPRAPRAFLGLPWGTELREAPGHGDAHPAHPRVLEPPAPHACPSWVTVPGAFSFSKDSVGFFLFFCFCSAEGPWTLRLPSVGANSYSLRCLKETAKDTLRFTGEAAGRVLPAAPPASRGHWIARFFTNALLSLPGSDPGFPRPLIDLFLTHTFS